jgi:hypothetical protein
MAVESITKVRFEELTPDRNSFAFIAAQEKNWFAHDTGDLMGTLSWDRADKQWNFAVLGRDQNGTFRWVEGGKSITTQEEAEERLAQSMERLAATGKKVFPKRA